MPPPRIRRRMLLPIRPRPMSPMCMILQFFPLLPGCSRPTRERSVLAGETDRHEQVLEISIVIVGLEGILTGEKHRLRSVSERESNEVCFDRAQAVEQVARVECCFDIFPDQE